jgi:hypothetical protein
MSAQQLCFALAWGGVRDGSLQRAQRALRALAPEYKWVGLGNLLGDFGEFIAVQSYGLTKRPPDQTTMVRRHLAKAAWLLTTRYDFPFFKLPLVSDNNSCPNFCAKVRAAAGAQKRLSRSKMWYLSGLAGAGLV